MKDKLGLILTVIIFATCFYWVDRLISPSKETMQKARKLDYLRNQCILENPYITDRWEYCYIKAHNDYNNGEWVDAKR